MKFVSKKLSRSLLCLFSISFLSSCSNTKDFIKKEEFESFKQETQLLLNETKQTLQTTNKQIEELSKKISVLPMSEAQPVQKKIPSQGILHHPAEHVGKEVSPLIADSDPEAGYQNDQATASYRKARVLFRAQKYPEAILAFSSFLEQFTDHVLAGSAQFYIAESYRLQSEDVLALKEYEKVLISFDRSPTTADALKQLSLLEAKAGNNEKSAFYRQKLLSLYSHSPAVADLEILTTQNPKLNSVPIKAKPEEVISIQKSDPSVQEEEKKK